MATPPAAQIALGGFGFPGLQGGGDRLARIGAAEDAQDDVAVMLVIGVQADPPAVAAAIQAGDRVHSYDSKPGTLMWRSEWNSDSAWGMSTETVCAGPPRARWMAAAARAEAAMEAEAAVPTA